MNNNPNEENKRQDDFFTKVSRDKTTGLRHNTQFVFTDDGFIDWRSMIPSKYFYFNPQRSSSDIEKKYGKKPQEINLEIDKVEDVDLCILLKGFKYIARLRGYTDVSYSPLFINEGYASIKCRVLWTSNYETNGLSVSFEDVGSASSSTTKGFGKLYLAEIATNRSFCRTVRNFLGIDILGLDEISGDNSPDEPTSIQTSALTPESILQSLLDKKGVSFEKLKDRLLKIAKTDEEKQRVEQYSVIGDIPKNEIYALITKIKKSLDKEEKNKDE